MKKKKGLDFKFELSKNIVLSGEGTQLFIQLPKEGNETPLRMDITVVWEFFKKFHVFDAIETRDKIHKELLEMSKDYDGYSPTAMIEVYFQSDNKVAIKKKK